MSIKTNKNINIVNKLNNIISENLDVYFQPQYSLKTNEMFGAEALIRLKNNDSKTFQPKKIIQSAEKFNLIEKISEIVLDNSCKTIKQTCIKVSVNISATQIIDENLIEIIQKYIKKYSIDPSLLTLEITETEFISNFKKAKKNIDKIKSLGVMIALDDFGIKYSSLAYISKLQFDYIKIDRSFLNGKKNKTIVISVIEMAKKLNLITVAEGVETLNQMKFLENNGCQVIQGYYYSKPLPYEEYLRFINSK